MTPGPYGQPFGRPWPRRGIGSGVILDGQGHILTTYHVVDGADKGIVTFADGRALSGTVVGGDDDTDVAIRKAESQGFAPAELAGSGQLNGGEPCPPIGNPP